MPDQACVTQQQQEKDHDEDQQIRANSYGLLATLLANPPSAELLTRLRSIKVDTNDPKDIINAWSMLGLAAQRSHVNVVADEYHDLFIGVGRGELVPFASWYLTGFLMEKPLAHLRQRLAEIGYERQENINEPEDHAAALCEVMGQLIIDNDADDETAHVFYEDFIGNWMGHFFHDLQNTESAGFYRAVGQLGESFMGIEKRYFSMTV